MTDDEVRADSAGPRQKPAADAADDADAAESAESADEGAAEDVPSDDVGGTADTAGTGDGASEDAASDDVDDGDGSTDGERDGSTTSIRGAGQNGAPSRGLFVGAIVFASVAFLAMVAFGVLWWTSSSDEEYRIASARDDVVDAASEGIRAYTEIDPQDVDGFRQAQRAVSTDDLFEQNSPGWERAKQQIQESEIAVDVEIYDTGVIELNSHRGEAVLITALEITRDAKEMEESTGRMRMIVQMQRVDDEWRLADIQHVPETGAGAGPGS